MNTDITKQMEMVLYHTEDDYVTVSALIKDEKKLPLAKIISGIRRVGFTQRRHRSPMKNQIRRFLSYIMQSVRKRKL